MTIWDVLLHFRREEFSNPDQMSENLLMRLDYARDLAGIPFQITSSYRAGDTRSHGQGLAVDLSCIRSTQRYLMLRSLIHFGFDRIGVYPRHLHVDLDPGLPGPVLWHGEYSKHELPEHIHRSD